MTFNSKVQVGTEVSSSHLRLKKNNNEWTKKKTSLNQFEEECYPSHTNPEGSSGTGQLLHSISRVKRHIMQLKHMSSYLPKLSITTQLWERGKEQVHLSKLRLVISYISSISNSTSLLETYRLSHNPKFKVDQLLGSNWKPFLIYKVCTLSVKLNNLLFPVQISILLLQKTVEEEEKKDIKGELSTWPVKPPTKHHDKISICYRKSFCPQFFSCSHNCCKVIVATNTCLKLQRTGLVPPKEASTRF